MPSPLSLPLVSRLCKWASALLAAVAAGMATEAEDPVGDSIVGEYQTYEDYLDSQISATDIYYLEDEDLARQLVELGYRGSGEILRRGIRIRPQNRPETLKNSKNK